MEKNKELRGCQCVFIYLIPNAVISDCLKNLKIMRKLPTAKT